MKSLIQRFARFGVAVSLLTLGFAGAQQSPKRCLMWRAVSGNNIVYLLGSIHIGSKDMYPLPKIVEDAYARSKVLVVEVDIKKMLSSPDQMGEMATEMQSKGLYERDDDLWKHLSNKTTVRVKRFCEKYGVDPDSIAKLKPWMAATILSTAPFSKSGMKMEDGIDMHFMAEAETSPHKKRVEQAETASFQFNLLSSLPENLGDDWLSYTVGQGDNTAADDTKIAKLWKQGNAKAIADVMLQVPESLALFQWNLLQERNPHMADVAEKYLKGNGPCFFVVGAAHLVGPDGVVAILQKRGYKVTQISAAESR